MASPAIKRLAWKGDLKKHIEIVHKGKKEHVCHWTGADGQPCNQAFGQKSSLQRHIETIHKGKKEHVCDWKRMATAMEEAG